MMRLLAGSFEVCGKLKAGSREDVHIELTLASSESQTA
jgi:hypothetical protein